MDDLMGIKSGLRTVDLFAGGGGLSAGFLGEGFNIVAAYEFWEAAALCYESNFSHPLIRADLSDFKQAVLSVAAYQPELIVGGPPCQDFSQAGLRVESGRADLTKSFADIVIALKPQYFVMENVDRIAKSDVYSKVRVRFKQSGYGLTERLLLASKCGVPQRRKRFFCLGSLNDPDGFLDERLLANLAEKEMTVYDYFQDSLDFEYYYRHPRNYSRRAIYSIYEPAATIRGVNRPIPKGYLGHPKDASPLNVNLRSLTTKERSLIQTFPSNYKWVGTKTDIEQIIGNAVPVKLAQYIAKQLKSHIET